MLRKGWKQKRKYGMMQEVEVLKTISELICSHFSEEQFTLSCRKMYYAKYSFCHIMAMKGA
jgi:hypothetical protein